MKRAFDWGFGIVVLLLGLGQGAWIAYNYLVEMQPEARGKPAGRPVARSPGCPVARLPSCPVAQSPGCGQVPPGCWSSGITSKSEVST